MNKVFAYCVVGKTPETIKGFETSLAVRGVKSSYCIHSDGTRMYCLDPSDLKKFPSDEKGKYVKSGPIMYRFDMLLHFDAFRKSRGYGDWVETAVTDTPVEVEVTPLARDPRVWEVPQFESSATGFGWEGVRFEPDLDHIVVYYDGGHGKIHLRPSMFLEYMKDHCPDVLEKAGLKLA